MPRTESVATTEGGVEGVERGLRGRATRKNQSEKETEEEVDLLENFFYHVYEFLYSFSKPATMQVHVNPVDPFVPVVIPAPFVPVLLSLQGLLLLLFFWYFTFC